MNSKFKALIKASGNNHLTNYTLTSYNEPRNTKPVLSVVDGFGFRISNYQI